MHNAYTLASSSYELNGFEKLDNNLSMLNRSTSIEDSLATSYSQHDKILESSSHYIKYNNSKIDIEMIQIENQLKNSFPLTYDKNLLYLMSNAGAVILL